MGFNDFDIDVIAKCRCGLRQQPLELESIEPIPVATDNDGADTVEHCDALERIAVGQWFRIDAGESDPVRVQLVLKMDAEQQLLFANQAGIKALQLDYRDFADLVTQRNIILLRTGASFSTCLARAVGINSSQSLKALTDAMAQTSAANTAAVAAAETTTEASTNAQTIIA